MKFLATAETYHLNLQSQKPLTLSLAVNRVSPLVFNNGKTPHQTRFERKKRTKIAQGHDTFIASGCMLSSCQLAHRISISCLTWNRKRHFKTIIKGERIGFIETRKEKQIEFFCTERIAYLVRLLPQTIKMADTKW